MQREQITVLWRIGIKRLFSAPRRRLAPGVRSASCVPRARRRCWAQAPKDTGDEVESQVGLHDQPLHSGGNRLIIPRLDRIGINRTFAIHDHFSSFLLSFVW
jgi:hypothetical protein